MLTSSMQLLKNLYFSIISDKIVYDEYILPAKHLRYCGSNFHDNEYYISSALKEANRLINELSLNKNSRILDVGCGVGRLAIGISKKIPNISEYCGIDVSERAIDWCNKYIHGRFANFNFYRLNFKNELYNKFGKELNASFNLPFADKRFEIIYLYSVFSHMRSNDILVYLREFNRVIKDQGRIFLTAFIEDGVEDETENPENYRMKWKMPLHCVRYERVYFDNLVKNCGFKIDRFDYEIETDGQSGIYLSQI